MRRLRSEIGQTAAEYLGVLLVVSVVIAGVAHNDIGHRIGCHMRAQVAKILGGDAHGGCGHATRGGPRATASAASADRDSDRDGIPDAEEIRRGTDPYSSDSDHDGVSDKDEIAAGLNPRDADTDHDGVSDGAELDRDSGLGIETALAELKQNPDIDVIFDGRPRPGRPSNGYDVVIVNSRPAGKGGYGSGVDAATDDIRRSGRVGSLRLVDVQRP